MSVSAEDLPTALEQLARSCDHVMSLDINAHLHGSVAVVHDANTRQYTATQCFLADPAEWRRAHLPVVYSHVE